MWIKHYGFEYHFISKCNYVMSPWWDLFQVCLILYTQLTNSYWQLNCKVQDHPWTTVIPFTSHFSISQSFPGSFHSINHSYLLSFQVPSFEFFLPRILYELLLHSSYTFSPSHFHYKYSNNTRWYVNITMLPIVNKIAAEFLILTVVLLLIQIFWDVMLSGLAHKCLLGLGIRWWRHQAAAKFW
jgi:hypothetical protein